MIEVLESSGVDGEDGVVLEIARFAAGVDAEECKDEDDDGDEFGKDR